MFAVVKFTKENKYSVVPVHWIVQNKCSWPTTESEMTYIKTNRKAESWWPTFEIQIIEICASFEEADERLKRLTPNVSPQKMKRRKLPSISNSSELDTAIEAPVRLLSDSFINEFIGSQGTYTDLTEKSTHQLVVEINDRSKRIENIVNKWDEKFENLYKKMNFFLYQNISNSENNVSCLDLPLKTVEEYEKFCGNLKEDEIKNLFFDWVCARGAYASIAQAVFFVGAICGGLIFGWIADYHGRKPALILTNTVGFLIGFMTAFVSNFPLFCLSRFLIGFAFDNCFTMMYIISLEYVGSKYRTFVANMSIAIFFTIATCLLPWIAVYLSDWRTLSIVTSLPSLCGIFIAIWFIPESARWLISKGEIDKAIEITKQIAKFNRKMVSDKVFIEFQDNCRKQNEAAAEVTMATSITGTSVKKSHSFLDLFRTPRLRRITILLIIIWMSISLVFDGHVRNVGSLGLDFFATFTMACATEFPADTFLTLVLDRWGRRWLAFATMACSGLFSLCSTLVPIGLSSAALAICGRMAVNIAYNIGLQYAAEVLPTVVRAQGVAVVHLMGYVACIIAPFIVLLAKLDRSLPFVILGTIGIIGGILALFLPETLNKDLPQTLQDGENFGTEQKFWSVPCLSRSEFGDDICESLIESINGPEPLLDSSTMRITNETLNVWCRAAHFKYWLMYSKRM